jgi:hypothetical protein
MGDFLFEIFKLRYAQKGSEWVFPSRQNEAAYNEYESWISYPKSKGWNKYYNA